MNRLPVRCQQVAHPRTAAEASTLSPFTPQCRPADASIEPLRRRSSQNTTSDPAVNATVRSTVITCADLPLPTAPPDRLVVRGVNDVDNGRDDDS